MRAPVGFGAALAVFAISLAVPVAGADNFAIGRIGGAKNTKRLKPKVEDGLESVLTELGYTVVTYREYLKAARRLGIKRRWAFRPDSARSVAQELDLRGVVYAYLRFNPRKRKTKLTVGALDVNGTKVLKEVYRFRGRRRVPENVFRRLKEDLAEAFSDSEAPDDGPQMVFDFPTDVAPSEEGGKKIQLDDEEAFSALTDRERSLGIDGDEGGSDGGEDGGGPFGRFYFGLGGDAAYSRATWGGSVSRAALLLLGNAHLGAAVTKEKVVFEIGAKVGYGISGSDKWPEKVGLENGLARWNHVVFSLVPRLMYPVVGRSFYLGGELEAGIDKSEALWVRGALRLGASLMVGRHFEIRLLPLGAEVLQEIEVIWGMVGYSGSASLVMRFG